MRKFELIVESKNNVIETLNKQIFELKSLKNE